VAEGLRGARVLQLNATPYGGGVSELLRSGVPLLNDLGLVCDWKIISGDDAFFQVTKTIHNGLQGADQQLTRKDRAIYLANTERNAALLEEQYDFVVVHDPQPAGIDLGLPLITQASRFDPWKDPLGVIASYRLVREEVPNLQLALDDPQGWEVYRQIRAASQADPMIHVFTNLTGVGNVEVNAFQRLSDVVVQKSLREGFGLVVSEALWKATPAVAGRRPAPGAGAGRPAGSPGARAGQGALPAAPAAAERAVAAGQPGSARAPGPARRAARPGLRHGASGTAGIASGPARRPAGACSAPRAARPGSWPIPGATPGTSPGPRRDRAPPGPHHPQLGRHGPGAQGQAPRPGGTGR
jgi:hypothetical protein